MNKKWKTINQRLASSNQRSVDEILNILLENRGIKTKKQIDEFLNPADPYKLSPKDVGINSIQLKKAILRIQKAIKNRESIVVYADYDADGITAGAIVWETLYKMGAKIMPYIPHRVDEGYGLSQKGIDSIKKDFNVNLIFTVDHGITGWEKIEYAKKLGIEVIVTDHHVKPKKLPDCLIIHTTQLSGAGLAWFVVKELFNCFQPSAFSLQIKDELLALAAIGTIADMVPLIDANRSITKYGLAAVNKTQRVGLLELIKDAGLTRGAIDTYNVSHILAPRLNAMGRIVHALDALRLLCTTNRDKAFELAKKLGLTNKERQQLTEETVIHAREIYEGLTLKGQTLAGKLIFISHEEFNQGVIGLVAGKLVEQYYRPAIVVTRGEIFSKASARSINGFNIIEAIRSCSELLVDAGGHPMAAGFTVETTKLKLLQEKLEIIADKELDAEKLTRVLKIDLEIPLNLVTEDLWQKIQQFAPFGMANFEPVFATKKVKVVDARLIGRDAKHLKLKIQPSAISHQPSALDAIGFGLGEYYSKFKPGQLIDIAYSIDMNVWNGNRSLQLKLKDIHI